MHGKAAADAGALAVTERLPGVDRALGFGLRREILGIEHVGVRTPDAGVAMQRHDEHRDEGAFLQLVLAADGLVLERRDAIGRRRRPQPQGLFQNLGDVGELRHLLIGRLGIDVGAEHAVDLVIGLLEDLGVFQQRIDRARQQSAGRLVPRDEERVDLVADVDVVELGTGGTVDAGHHRAEHVLLDLGRIRVLAALGDDLVDHLVHEADVGDEVAAPLLHPQILQRQAAGHHDGFQRAHQRFHEGVVIPAVKRIEAVVEATQPDGVERQRRHVVDDVDLIVRVEPFPFLHQLLGDVDHARVVGRHGAIAERLQQDVVRLAPVRLIGVGCEQAVAADRAHPAKRAAHSLVEALLVGELVDQIMAGDDDERGAHHVEPVDRT
ncbi:hypothetical protein ES707_06495 [subsurface metagenome]